MKDNDALIQIVNRRVACLVDNSDVPRQAPYIPYNPAHLRGAPAADISNEEIQHLIDAGLANRSELNRRSQICFEHGAGCPATVAGPVRERHGD